MVAVASVVSDLSGSAGHNAMILVFPNVAAAELNRRLAAEQDQVDAEGGIVGMRGPRLIAGYGYRVWFENVAIVQVGSDARVDSGFLSALMNTQFALQAG
jgi:hypothetical protein